LLLYLRKKVRYENLFLSIILKRYKIYQDKERCNNA
jgi:hypothetical protein